jgi:lipoprotein-anchoring transpeptidase ErfK/SrfK
MILTTSVIYALFSYPVFATYEVSGSPYDTRDAPLPSNISPQGEKVIIVSPNAHAWGAYSADGHLVRWGIATCGRGWCPDIHRHCRTKSGTFRIYSMGDSSCISRKFPVPDGGAPMPYCMYFNGGQALHGSYEVVYGNASHGCVRLHVSDARWLRYHFVEGPNSSNGYRGTKVIIRPYR